MIQRAFDSHALAVIEASDAAGMIMRAIREDNFLAVTSEHIVPRVRQRAADMDGFIDHQIANPHIVIPAEVAGQILPWQKR